MLTGVAAFGLFALQFNQTARDAVWTPAAAAVRSLASMIGDRSPGERPDGVIAKAKKRRPVLDIGKDEDGVRRRLAPRGPRPPDTFADRVLVPDGPLSFGQIPQVALPPEPAAPGSAWGDGAGRPSYILLGGGGPAASSGGSGGGGGPGSETGSSGGSSSGGSTVPAVPMPAVPEPGTWLMMIAGFGTIGVMLRRRARRTRPSAS